MIGLASTAACTPAVVLAPQQVYPPAVTLPLFWFCTTILWAFVFGWHFEYTGRPVFKAAFKPRLWVLATVYALAAGAFAYWLLDPPLRRLIPVEYPSKVGTWTAATTFQILFMCLFACFAPYDFAMRLSRHPSFALTLAVLWGLFLPFLRLSALETLPPIGVTAMILGLRIVAGVASVYFYLNGGVLLVWWVALVLQARLLLEIR